MSKIFLGALTFFVVSLCLTACDNNEKETAPVIRPVKVMTVGAATSRQVRNFPGKVIASQRADLSFNVPGLLIEFPILEGDHVSKGDLLAKLDPETYQEAANETKAKYIRAKAQFERAEQLIQNKYLSQADYDNIQSTYLVSETNYNRAKRNLSDTRILAPFDGIIAQTFVDNHQNVKNGELIATIHDTENIDIEIDVPESLIIKLRQENAADLTKHIKAIFEAKPDTLYPLTYKEASTEADKETQTYRIVFKMPAPEDLNVLPGMTVTIRSDIPQSSQHETDKYFLVPNSAVFNEQDTAYVWKINSDSMTVEKTPVTVGKLTGKDIQILSGLSPDDQIVIAGVHFLQENQQVKILED
jgi:RND family efflux transporter MFP subunit